LHSPVGGEPKNRSDADECEGSPMAKFVLILLVLSSWSLTPARAQAPLQPDVVPAARLNLTLEQKHVVKELVKELRIEPTTVAGRPSVGDRLPQDAHPRPVTGEIGQKVPQIKAHLFLVTADRILIIDPKDDKIAEAIDLKSD